MLRGGGVEGGKVVVARGGGRVRQIYPIPPPGSPATWEEGGNRVLGPPEGRSVGGRKVGAGGWVSWSLLESEKGGKFYRFPH